MAEAEIDILSFRIMEMSASIAEEISARWPYAIARLQVELSGSAMPSTLAYKVEDLITLGLSGLTSRNWSFQKAVAILALQQRTMGIRLSGRKLVAFHPARDLRFNAKMARPSYSRIQVSAYGANALLIDQTIRKI